MFFSRFLCLNCYLAIWFFVIFVFVHALNALIRQAFRVLPDLVTWRNLETHSCQEPKLSSQLDCVSRCFFVGHLINLIILIRRWGWCFRLSSRMPLWRGKSMHIRRYDVPEFLLVHLVPEDWLQLQVYAPSSFSAEMLAMRACIGNVMKQTPLAQRKDSSNMIGHAARTRRTRAARNYKMYSLQIRSIQS